jgi:cardiolipin synthase
VVDGRGRAGEVEVVHRVSGDDVDVTVRYLEAGDDESDSRTREHSALGPTDATGHVHDPMALVGREIEPVVHLATGHDQRVTRRDGVDREERDDHVVGEHPVAGEFVSDDAGEHRRHAVTLVAGTVGDVGGTDSRIVTWPNVVTLTRLLALVPFAWLLLVRDERAVAAVVLGGIGVSDWVDGWLARRLDQRSNFGSVFDPVADRILFIVGAGIVLIDGAIPLWFGLAIAIREALVGLVMTVATAFGMRRFPVSTLGKRYTFLLMSAVPLLLLGVSDVAVALPARFIGWSLGLPALILGWLAALMYVPEIRQNLRAGRATRSLP